MNIVHTNKWNKKLQSRGAIKAFKVFKYSRDTWVTKRDCKKIMLIKKTNKPKN